MKPKARRFDWYPGDILQGTAGKLSFAENGVFRIVLDFIYDSGDDAWPEDAGYLAWFCREEEETARRLLDSVVEKGKLRRVKRGNATFLVNNRASAEIERTRKRINGARENAKKRWDNSQIDAPRIDATAPATAYETAYAVAERTHSRRNASSQQPAASNHQPAASSQQPAGGQTEPAPASPRSTDQDKQLEDRILEAAKIDPARWLGNFGMLATWRNQGATDADILAGIEVVAARKTYRPPASLAYFTNAISDAKRCRIEAEASGRDPPMGSAASASILDARLNSFRSAREAATAKGLKAGDPGFPSFADFGLYWSTAKAGLAPIDGWKPRASDGAAA